MFRSGFARVLKGGTSRKFSKAVSNFRGGINAATMSGRSTNHNWQYSFAAGFAALGVLASENNADCETECILPIDNADPNKLISYKCFKNMAEVDDKIVVAFRGSVYDVTHFTGHPGGVGRLQMASGQDLEVFWRVYTQHNRGHVDKLLLRYRIGRLSLEDALRVREETTFTNPYENDPPISPHLLTNTRYPYNAEARISYLTDDFVTPIGKHFVRNHCHVPDIDPEEYTLTVCGAGLNETTFTLHDLKTKFEPVDVHTVIQCNGNRREDYHMIDGETPAFGPPHWGKAIVIVFCVFLCICELCVYVYVFIFIVAGAIGCSKWTGPRLRDVLKAAGLDVDNISLGKVPPPPNATHVGLTGYDIDEVGNQYCCSFSFEKAIDPFGDVILAYKMNDVDIPRSHGYPVRAITPGLAGARNCKFLAKVTLTDQACSDASNWKQYAVHAPDVPLVKLQEFCLHADELKKDPPVQEMPVQSIITFPTAGHMFSCKKCDTIKIKGLAWGGGGSDVNRVDVSLDGGKHFTKADVVTRNNNQRRGSNWSWVFFEKDVPLTKDMKESLAAGKFVKLELCSKALNTSWNVQPEDPLPNKNAHGCCVNHWYRVPASVCPVIVDDIPVICKEGEFANKPSGGEFKTPFRNMDKPCEALKLRQLEGNVADPDCVCK